MNRVYVVLVWVAGGIAARPTRLSRAKDSWGVLFAHDAAGTYFEERRTAKEAIRRTVEWWAKRPAGPCGDPVTAADFRVVRLNAEDE